MSRFRLVLAATCLASTLGVACSDPVLTAPPGSSRVDIFDDVWRDFDLNYSFFVLKGIDWDSVRTVYRPRAAAAANDAELARVLGDMLMTLHDRHVSLSTPGRTVAYQSRTDLVAAAFDPALIERRYLASQGTSAGGHVHYGMVSPTLGYLRIPSFDGSGWSAELDEALAALPAAHALIVDIRDNNGGTNGLAIDMAGRFAAASHTFGYVRIRQGPHHDDFTDFIPESVSPKGVKQFTGPVFLLTNRKDYSSAEDFVLALRTLPNVTTVGDTTAGASGHPLVRELPNGWTFSLSTWIEYTPEHTTFENIGLAPAVYVPSALSDLAAGRDPILERAVALASGR
jgi:hypothetical protein